MPKPFSDPVIPSNEELSAADVPRISRRRFGQHAAIAAALSLSPVQLFAASHDSHRKPMVGAEPESRNAADLTPEQMQDVDAKLANIVRKYGSRLSDDQRQHLRHILSYNEKMLVSIRTFPLKNGDPPASVLRVSLAGETLRSETHHSAAGHPPGFSGETEEGKT